MNRVDKARLGVAFTRGAVEYDAHAVVQRAAVERVVELVAEHSSSPRRVLDVGAGTGTLLASLVARHPRLAAAAVDLAPGMARAASERVGPRCVVGDAEALPFGASSFDLVVSSSAFQWLPSLDAAVSEAARVLEPGGTLVVAFFGEDTLRELRGAWRSAARGAAADRLHAFFGREDLESALRNAGLSARWLGVERHVERHATATELLRALRRIGAGNAAPDRPRSLAEARVLRRTIASYEELRGPDGVPATWDIVCAAARRP